MDRDTLTHSTVKCRPCGKPGNGNTPNYFRLLLETDLVMRHNPMLLLLLMIVLCNRNEYLHTFEFPACDTWAIILFKFRLFAISILK
jgi:hypothetical protein